MLTKILLLVVTCILLTLLFIQVPEFISVRLIDTLWPLGHVVSFAFWAWLLLSFNTYIRESNSQRQLLIVILATFLIGGVIELIQPFFSRSAQLSDIFYNLFGALGGYLLFGGFKKDNKRLLALRGLFILSFLYLLFPAMQTAKDEYRMLMDFPTIAKFDNSAELTRWKADSRLTLSNSNQLPQTNVTDTNLMKASFKGKDASRVVLRYFSGDWQAYNQIKFSFFNPNDSTLKIRLIMTDINYDKETSEDHTSDSKYRFEQWVMLEPGWVDFNIALDDIKNASSTNMLDLSNMAGIDLYMYDLAQPITLYVHQIKLLAD